MDKNQHEESTTQLTKADTDQNAPQATQPIKMDKNQQGIIMAPSHPSMYEGPPAVSRTLDKLLWHMTVCSKRIEERKLKYENETQDQIDRFEQEKNERKKKFEEDEETDQKLYAALAKRHKEEKAAEQQMLEALNKLREEMARQTLAKVNQDAGKKKSRRKKKKA